MTPIVAFYSGEGMDAQGRYLHDYLHFTHGEMESIHDWVQWAFPLPEPSGAQPQAPVLTTEDLEVFRTRSTFQQKAKALAGYYMEFLEGTTMWRRDFDHNHLRITRVLRFLVLIGSDRDALHFLLKVVKLHLYATESSLQYWMEALKENPAWLQSEARPYVAVWVCTEDGEGSVWGSGLTPEEAALEVFTEVRDQHGESFKDMVEGYSEQILVYHKPKWQETDSGDAVVVSHEGTQSIDVASLQE